MASTSACKRLLLACALASVAAFRSPARRLVARPARPCTHAPPRSPRRAVAARASLALEVVSSGDAEADARPFTETNLCKGLIMFALVLQSAGTSLLARRACQTCDYSGAVASITQEFVKPLLALCWLAARRTPVAEQRQTLKAAYGRPRDMVVLGVPALCFAAQNVLFFFAHERLSSTVYLVLSQSKTLFTAAFSVTLLGRTLSKRQWAAQPALMAGCALVLARAMASSGGVPSGAIAGALACLASGALSGFANVYFEKILKGKNKGTGAFWPRQLQLSLLTALCTVPALPACSTLLGELAKFTPLVWTVVLCKAVGGLLIGATIQYASAISKNFASAIAIVLTAAVAADARASGQFKLGIAFVLGSMVLFQSKGNGKTKRPTVAEWRAACDAGGVVSYADFGVKL